MNKKKVIYIGILLIVTVMVSITAFSYAYLTKIDEQHGKLNMTVGNLDYKIESDDLNNNSITLGANESKEIELTIRSLNQIDSKYKLYTNSVENVSIGYLDETGFDESTGTISATGTVKVKIVLDNESDTSKTITFGVQGGFDYNDVTLKTGRVEVEEGEGLCKLIPGVAYEFDYTGDEQEFIAQCKGKYKIEAWGAQGGFYQQDVSLSNFNGYGGYAYGVYEANSNDKLYINVGGQGMCGYSSTPYLLVGGYNGGGSSFTGTSVGNVTCSGGGATHIATDSGLLSSLSTKQDKIIMVAGGGGGIGPDDDRSGAGGGTYGGNGSGTAICHGHGGTQTGLRNDSNCNTAGLACFGSGNSSSLLSGAGGGGLYGGDNGASDNANAYVASNHSCIPFAAHDSHGTNIWGAGGGGGSGYLKSNLVNKGFYCYTGCGGDDTIVVNTAAEHVEKKANKGNGYARITYLGELSITFDAGNGIVNEPIRKVSYGFEIGELPIPTNGDKEFEGWYLEDTFNTLIDKNYIVTDDIVLYAKFAPARTYLYKNGTVSDLVGSFTKREGHGIEYSTSGTSVTYASTYIRINSGNGGTNNYGVGLISNNKIDVSEYSKLCVTASHSGSGCSYNYGHYQFGIGTSNTSSGNYIGHYSGIVAQGDDSTSNCIDISSYDSSYYLILHNAYSGYSDFYEVWLEKDD